jgi:hypothetical protein
LADRLAGVEEKGHAGFPGYRPDLFRRVDQTAIGGDVADGDQLGALIDCGGQGGHIDLAAFVTGDDLHLGTMVTFRLEVHDEVGGVLGLGGEDDVAFAEPDRSECEVPGNGGVVDDRNLLGGGPDQVGDRPVDRIEPLLGGGGRLVATDGGLQPEMLDLSFEHGLGHEGCPGIVEMYSVGRPRGGGARPFYVEHGWRR